MTPESISPKRLSERLREVPDDGSLSEGFLQHAAVCTSQYDGLCRKLAAEILRQRALLSDAARLAELVAEYQRLSKAYDECNHRGGMDCRPLGAEVIAAEDALLNFDLGKGA